MRRHEIEYQVYGNDIQFVEIHLDRGETVIGETGAMVYMDGGLTFEARMGDGTDSDQGFMARARAVARRAVTGESLFLTHFTNVDGDKRRVAFAALLPGRVVPIDLARSGGRVIARRSAFLCAARGTTLDVVDAGGSSGGSKWMTRLAGGEGWVLQLIEGDGLAFLNAAGAVTEQRLDGDKLLVDTNCVVGFEAGIDYSVERAGNLRSMFLGGEGLFLATLQGTGRVWLQSTTAASFGDELCQTGPWLRSELGSSSRSAGEGDD